MKEVRLRNLTGHEITLVRLGLNLPPDPQGQAKARPSGNGGEIVSVDGKPLALWYLSYNGVEVLPEPEDGVLLITSLVVALVARRIDVVHPAGYTRNERGQVIGCEALARVV